MTDNEAEKAAPEPRTDGADAPDSAAQHDDSGQDKATPETSADQANPEDFDDDLDEWRNGATVINHFHSNVEASQAQFGVSGGNPARRATGPIDRAQADHLLRHFVAPPRFSKALEILRKEHLVLLAGEDALGKATSALALLREILGERAPLSSLSPALKLGELAAYKFKNAQGYQVKDRIGDADAAALQSFEIDRLATNLKRANGYMVITTNVPAKHRHLGGLVIDWEPPAALELFDRCLPETVPEDITRARQRAAKLRSPKAIVTLAESVPSGVDAALASLDDSEARQVSEWFSDDPDRRSVLTVAALAFAHGLPVRTFEELLARLVDRAEPVPVNEASEAPLRQARADWGKHPLAKVTQDIPEAGHAIGERRVVFKSVEYRERVIGELVDRFGFDLWDPLRSWLHELAEQSSSEVRVQIALGIALLAKVSPREADDDYLQVWSDGSANQRLTAAHALSWMCFDEALAPLALHIAVGWTDNAGTNRAVTSAIALGGELGLRYPADAMRLLWFLAKRSRRLNKVAGSSLDFLFATSMEHTDVGMVLNFLHRLALSDIEGRVDHRRRRLALGALVTLLSGTCQDSTEPVPAFILRNQPATAPQLGQLWAWTLRSGSHRREAIEALRKTLLVLAEHQGTKSTVDTLGRSVREGMSDAHLALLQRDLSLFLPDNAMDNRPNARELVTALRVALHDSP